MRGTGTPIRSSLNWDIIIQIVFPLKEIIFHLGTKKFQLSQKTEIFSRLDYVGISEIGNSDLTGMKIRLCNRACYWSANTGVIPFADPERCFRAPYDMHSNATPTTARGEAIPVIVRAAPYCSTGSLAPVLGSRDFCCNSAHN